jgi:hypothetical protein
MLLLLDEEDRIILTRLEEDMWREVTRFDRNFQEQRFAADFFEFGRSGRVYTRDRIVLLDSQPIHAVLPLPNLAIRLLDRHTAQVTFAGGLMYAFIDRDRSLNVRLYYLLPPASQPRSQHWQLPIPPQSTSPSENHRQMPARSPIAARHSY